MRVRSPRCSRRRCASGLNVPRTRSQCLADVDAVLDLRGMDPHSFMEQVSCHLLVETRRGHHAPRRCSGRAARPRRDHGHQHDHHGSDCEHSLTAARSCDRAHTATCRSRSELHPLGLEPAGSGHHSPNADVSGAVQSGRCRWRGRLPEIDHGAVGGAQQHAGGASTGAAPACPPAITSAIEYRTMSTEWVRWPMSTPRRDRGVHASCPRATRTSSRGR